MNLPTSHGDKGHEPKRLEEKHFRTEKLFLQMSFNVNHIQNNGYLLGRYNNLGTHIKPTNDSLIFTTASTKWWKQMRSKTINYSRFITISLHNCKAAIKPKQSLILKGFYKRVSLAGSTGWIRCRLCHERRRRASGKYRRGFRSPYFEYFCFKIDFFN